MALVVSDTSPIRALAFLNLLDLLRAVYVEVLIPPAVEAELRQPQASHVPVVNVASLPFVRLQAPQDQIFLGQLLQQGLHRGEAEALVLAGEVQASTILMDERAGRAMAKQLGLVPTGVLGTLVEAKQRGLVTAVLPLMEHLEQGLRFFISPALRATVLQLAGE
jgi:predicted nucleic acid-binding protein